MTTEEGRAWADALAASLPPMSPAECAVVGRIAATLDARRVITTPPRSTVKRDTTQAA